MDRHEDFSSNLRAPIHGDFDEEAKERLKDSLKNINPFSRKVVASRHPNTVRVLEIVSSGSASYKDVSIWGLFRDIIFQTRTLDSKIPTHETNSFINSNACSSTTLIRTHGAAVELSRRDLRALDLSAEQEPNILIRRHVTVFILDPIRAIVMADKLVVVVLPGSDSLLEILQTHMTEWVPEANVDGIEVRIPFELHAYEAIFTTVKVLQSRRLEHVECAISDLLAQMQKGSLLPLKLQEEMRELKNTASQMGGVVGLYGSAINDLAMNADHMALMNLSKLCQSPSLYSIPLSPDILGSHEEVEELLQTYAMDYDSLSTKLKFLKEKIENAEDLVSLRLDTSRNELLICNTAFSLLSCCIGLGAYLTGVFGMNLDNTISIQPVRGVFATIWAGSTAVIIVMFATVYGYLGYTGVLPQRTKYAGPAAKMSQNHNGSSA